MKRVLGNCILEGTKRVEVFLFGSGLQGFELSWRVTSSWGYEIAGAAAFYWIQLVSSTEAYEPSSVEYKLVPHGPRLQSSQPYTPRLQTVGNSLMATFFGEENRWEN